MVFCKLNRDIIIIYRLTGEKAQEVRYTKPGIYDIIVPLLYMYSAHEQWVCLGT